MLRCAQFVVVVGKESVKNSVGVGAGVCKSRIQRNRWEVRSKIIMRSW